MLHVHRRTFDELDVDGSGTLSLVELQSLLGDGAEAAFAALDTTQTDEVSYTEFMAAMVAGQQDFQTDAYIRAAFDGIDADGSGEISLEEIMQVRPRA